MFTCSFILAQKMTKKWFYVLGFIGIVIQFAGLLILGGVLLVSKWNLITRYPVIFNFRVGTGRVLEKKFGTGRVPGSRRTLVVGTHPECQLRWTRPRCQTNLGATTQIVTVQLEIKSCWQNNFNWKMFNIYMYITCNWKEIRVTLSESKNCSTIQFS